MKLLDAVSADTTGSAVRVAGPCAVFIEGTLGGGTVSIQAARTSSGTFVEIVSKTTVAVVIDAIIGPHYLRAVLSGSTGPSLTVAVA